MAPVFRILGDDQLEIILHKVWQLLDTLGVKLTHPKGRRLLQKAGARLDDDRAYIPAQLVRQALLAAPPAIDIYDRLGQSAMHLGGRNAYFGAHTDAPDVLDPFSHARRPCLEADIAGHARLADALPNIHFLTASGLVADQPPELGDQVALKSCLINSTKPVLAMPVTPASLQNMHAMAALVAGGEDVLQNRPNLIIYAEPVSPLNHPDQSISKLLYCAQHRLPVAYVPYAARGGTAPISQAAILAQLTAESLSALVIHQLQEPGAPFIFGGMASIMDMKTTVFSYGAPEFQLGNTMMAEIAHHLNLPNFGTAGTSDAQEMDGQAVLEATSSCLMAYMCGAHLVHDIGLMGNATVIIPDMVVVCDLLAEMAARLFSETAVNEETLSLELFATGVKSGEYVSDPATLEQFRQVWYPGMLYRAGAKDWSKRDQHNFEKRTNARTRQLISYHTPHALAQEHITALQAIIQRSIKD